MKTQSLFAALVLAACSAKGTEGNEATAANEAITARVPPGASNGWPLYGAVPGPCGSTGASRFLRRDYTPDLLPALKKSSGADDVRVYDPRNPTEPNDRSIPGRLNVMLDDKGRIVLLDCG